jgi:uncharacterized membrane protein
MRPLDTLFPLLLLMFTAAGDTVAQAEAVFLGLGDLPGGGFTSVGIGVSPDGGVAVGLSQPVVSRNEGFRWEDGVMEGIGDLPGGLLRSQANAASEGGLVVVGTGADSASVLQAVRWEGGALTSLGFLAQPLYTPYSHADDLSADGRIIVGSSTDADGVFRAVRWVDEVIEVLAGIPLGANESFATGTSFDGRVIVGSTQVGLDEEAFRWEDGVFELLGDLPGGPLESRARDVSANGLVVVGRGFSDRWREAFRWEDGVMESLGDLQDSHIDSEALGVSGDGSVVVGYGQSSGGQRAFVWNRANGLRDLKDVLESDFGLDLGDWILSEATGVSDDGRSIVGTGTNPSGLHEGWIALFAPTIPVGIDIRPWSAHNYINPFSRMVFPVALLGSNDFDVADVDVTSLAFGLGGALPIWGLFLSHWDVNDDGWDDGISYYRSEETGIAMGDTEACLTGETLDGIPFKGCDAISTVSCGLGVELLFILPPLMWLRGRRRRKLG